MISFAAHKSQSGLIIRARVSNILDTVKFWTRGILGYNCIVVRIIAKIDGTHSFALSSDSEGSC